MGLVGRVVRSASVSPVDGIEHVFDHKEMTPTASLVRQAQDLQGRIRQAEGVGLASTTLETLPAFAGCLPGGALRTGAAYSVSGSTHLAMALLAGPSAAGAWCGVAGVPTFGAEAAAATGVDLSRTILVPDLGDQWTAVLAALIDVLAVIVVRPPLPVAGADAARLGARLRQRGATLVCLGEWPRSEAQLAVTDSDWLGLGAGHGHLLARRVTVTASSRAGGGRRVQLWLPGPDQRVRAVGADDSGRYGGRQHHGGGELHRSKAS